MDRNVESPYRNIESPYNGLGSEWEDSIGYFINETLRVWCLLSNGEWQSGRIQSSTGEEASVSLSKGKVVKVSTGEILPADPDFLEGVDELVQLIYLNEPSVLHNLRCRYLENKIYSKAGRVLIAINPFKDVPIYGSDFVDAYRQNLMTSPHIFAIADTAYKEMIRDERNQSIITSGESGAGKTEAAKLAMQYLSTLGNGTDEMECKILQSNLILEAFGNAKTSRNANSSRFGKLIEINFSASGKICGAKIHTFFLEKSRVVQLANGERTYHIFYQLCAGAPSHLRERLNVKSASEYSYLNQSECLAIDGIDDAYKFNRLMEALHTLQIGKEGQENIFALLAAVLWLGNISFQVIDNENHVEVLANEAVTTAARLIGCSPQELVSTLSTHKSEAGKGRITKKLTREQAINRRDALANYIYESLFDWLVEQVNKSLEKGKHHTWRSISILDISGFESFKKNSFEQFCINYANERLQQHFNRHLFKLEQEEYESDGINWTKIDFEDNEKCLNLIEKKPVGILSLLDNESNIPKATDLTFSNKLKQHASDNPCFKGERGRAFGIRHCAGEVVYDPNGFLEKNRDAVQSELVQLLLSSSCPLPQLFASKILEQHHKPHSPNQSGAKESQKQSTGAKLKDLLFKLIRHLESTTPHFICCINPNSRQLPGMYDEDLVLQQLRSFSVLEAVRIARFGYPTRMTHEEFSKRYGFLLVKRSTPEDPLSTSVDLLKQFNILPGMYQVGFTKLYLQTGQIDPLEERRKQVLQCVISVQKHFRGCQARRRFQDVKSGVPKLQSLVRGQNARRQSQIEPISTFGEQVQAAIHIQSVIRGILVRKQFGDMPQLRELKLENAKFKTKADRKVSEAKGVPQYEVQSLSSVMEELQKQVLKAETILGQKEKENAALKEKLQHYEEKMKKMENMLQKQMGSMQMSLTAARKSLAVDNTAGRSGRMDSTSPPYYDSEDGMSTRSHTPGVSTPKLPNSNSDLGAREVTNGALNGVGARGNNGALNAVNNLVKEFEQKKRAFDDDVKSLEKLGQSVSNRNPDEELKNLKLQFQSWKKEYKVRLRDTKARLLKLGISDKGRRKWWTMIGSRGT